MGFPPIGIMSLSAVLKREGHECIIFDQANPETPNEVIIEEIKRKQPALVGLSFLSTTSYPYAKILARQIRASDPKVKLAFGGVFASLNAPLVKLQCPEVDFVCRGDGEQLILDLLEQRDDPSGVASVTWAKDGKVVSNPNRVMDRNLDQWPFPDRESLPLDFVESMPLDVPAVLSLDRFTTMQTSRGCPWSCVFCDIPIFNEGNWRSRSPQHVLAEFKHLQELGYGSVYFVDDHFLLQPKRIETICEGLVKQGNTIQWGCEGRVDSVAQHLFPAMAKASCRTLMFGLESGSQKMLDRLRKEQTLAEVETAVKNAKQAGIEIVHGFFVVGIPDETAEDMKSTFDFAARAAAGHVRIQPALRLSRHAAVAGIRQARPSQRSGRLVQIFQVFRHRSHLPAGETINDIRRAGLRRLFIKKLLRYPVQTFRLLRRFLRYMPARDVLYLVAKPFLETEGRHQRRSPLPRRRARRRQGRGGIDDAIERRPPRSCAQGIHGRTTPHPARSRHPPPGIRVHKPRRDLGARVYDHAPPRLKPAAGNPSPDHIQVPDRVTHHQGSISPFLASASGWR